jgi:prolipoprotein diacylglyceryltransferase
MQQVLWRIPLKTAWTPDGIPLYGFGVMLCLTFLLCTWLASRRAARVGMSKEQVQDLVIWLFVCGLLGARITFLLGEQAWRGWVDFILSLPQIWNGGIVLYGSILGGLFGYLGFWYFTFRKLPITTLQLADILAPCITLGLCLGRIGCFLNGCCYGQVACPDCVVYPAVHYPLSAPPREGLVEAGYQTAAGFTFAERQASGGARVGHVVPGSPAWDSGLRPGDRIVRAGGHDIRVPEDLSAYITDPRNWRGKNDLELSVIHEGAVQAVDLPPFVPRTLGLYPTQLYEVVSMALLMLVLFAYEPLRRRPGQVMAILMMGYAIHRYLNEMLRDDPRPKDFELYSSLFLFGAGLAMWLWLQLSGVRTRAATATPQPVGAGV